MVTHGSARQRTQTGNPMQSLHKVSGTSSKAISLSLTKFFKSLFKKQKPQQELQQEAAVAESPGNPKTSDSSKQSN